MTLIAFSIIGPLYSAIISRCVNIRINATTKILGKMVNRRFACRGPLSGIHHCKHNNTHIAMWSYHTKWWMHVTSSSYIPHISGMWMGAGNRLYADGRMRLLRCTEWKRQFECTIQRLGGYHRVFDIINSRIVLF